MNEVQPALLPDRSYTFHLGNDVGDSKPMQIFLEVAIFVDGSALGEPEAIRSLWKRREWLFTEYREALEVADRGMTNPKDRDGAIKALGDVKSEKIQDTSRSIEERKAVATAFDDVASNLKRLSSAAYPGDTIAQLRKRAMDRESAFRLQNVPAQVQASHDLK